MKIIISRSPIEPAHIDFVRASCPRVAPIVYSPVRTIGAGIAPVFKSRASDCASSVVKSPVICALPPAIFSFTRGAEINSPPTKIATLFPVFLPEINENEVCEKMLEVFS